MRRNTILMASLPLANGLSLANFQDITSVLIPLTCQFTYDSQIPSCVVADFQDAGCSPECAKSLSSVAVSVSQACSNVLVNSNTLLGIIKNGGILQALCPTMQKPPSPPKPSSPPAQQTVPPPSAPDSVTLPTSSPGVVVSTTTSKSTPTVQPVLSTTTNSKSATKSTSSAVETTIDSISETTNTAVTTPTPSQSPDADGSDGAAATTSTEETSTTSANKGGQTQKAQPQSDTGGGSPFDISANSGKRLGEGSMLACVVAVWAGIILGR